MTDNNTMPSLQPPAPPPDALDKTPGADQTIQPSVAGDGGFLGRAALGALDGANKTVNAPASSSKNVLMLSPDGQTGEVPGENVSAAVKAGGKVGVRMLAPDGSKGVIPVDRVHDAIQAGGSLVDAENITSSLPEETQALGGQWLSPEAQEEANKKLAPASAALTAGLLSGPLSTAAFEAVGGGLLGSAAAGGAGGATGAVTQQVGKGENPLDVENLEDTAIQTGVGAALGSLFYAGGRVYQAVRGVAKDVTDTPVAQQGAKDAIRKILGTKADAEITQGAYDLLENKVPKNFSNPENELKLVKPKLDARLTVNNAALDRTLAGNTKPIQNVAAQASRVFDSAIEDVQKSVGINKDAQIAAINEVKNSILPRLQDEMTPQEVNQAKRLVGDEIKKFAMPEMLDTPQKAAQEAYRQTYFKLRDIVSEAVPKSAELNQQISRDINLQDLLEKKFPHLDTKQAAQNSYDAVRQAGKRELIKDKIIRYGVPAAAVEGLNLLGHSSLNPWRTP